PDQSSRPKHPGGIEPRNIGQERRREDEHPERHIAGGPHRMTTPLAPMRPIEIGSRPAWTAIRQGASLKRSHTPPMQNASTHVGPHIAAVLTHGASTPAT